MIRRGQKHTEPESTPERLEALLNATTPIRKRLRMRRWEIIRTPFGARQLRYRRGVNDWRTGNQRVDRPIQAQINEWFGIAELTRNRQRVLRRRHRHACQNGSNFYPFGSIPLQIKAARSDAQLDFPCLKMPAR